MATAQSARPSPGQMLDESTITVTPRTTAMPQDANQAELLQNRDGRVRNPVPSKLKGKTDQKQGNFSVMHMGQSPGGKKAETHGRDAAAERDAAARRTSENTASRAKAAQQEKYVPPRQRGLEVAADRASPFATGEKQRGRPLAPDETKHEQARLLTLLRSINPVTVVDQICKAVAYFGGIPGAPPPEDGIFPESMNTRETGALFIGWLSEIFPDLASNPDVPRMQAPPSGGKKQTKAGKAKIEMPPDEPPNPRNGFGFGQAVSAPAWGLPQSLSLVNTSMNATPDMGQAPNAGVEPAPQVGSAPQQQSPATPLKQQTEAGPSTSASNGKRGRGRPKGSTNKAKKANAQGSGDVSATTEAGGQQSVMNAQAVQQSPQIQGAAINATDQNHTSYISAPVNQTSAAGQSNDLQYPLQPWQTNLTANHTTATTVTNAVDVPSPEELAILNAFKNGAMGTTSMTPTAAHVALPVQNTTGTGGGVKRKRAPAKPKQPAVIPATQAAPISSGEPQMVAQPPPSAQYTPILPPSKLSSAAAAKDVSQWSPANTTTPILITAPPAKRPRQRKPKVVTADPPSRQQSASVVSQPTPTMMPSTIPDSQASTSTQQSVPVSRAPAEGLEAHYERFATASEPQQNGRSHTPSTSVSSITPQQHLRQLQKPSSVPPQSQQHSSAQSNTQLQMQRQKSQQSQREEQQKLAQAATTAISSSAGFYNQQQQRQPTYSNTQQYHQPSQLSYGTHSNTSPQMSNNSYRSNSTHTAAQASPQFSQPETSYRTASPHTNTIAQPSPSFAQPESNYRTTSTHNAHSIAQPSPTYSQPENPYRNTSITNTTLGNSSLGNSSLGNSSLGNSSLGNSSLGNSSLGNSSMGNPSLSTTHSNPTPSFTRTPHTQTQPSHQSHYSHFPDATSYVDLPTLDSLGHSGGSSSNTLSAGGYGQQSLLGSSSASRSGSHSLYGTSPSGLNNAFDTSTNDLLRGVSRGGGAGSSYGTSSGLGAFDTEQDFRERMMRLGRR